MATKAKVIQSEVSLARSAGADESDSALARGLAAGLAWAAGELYDRFGPKLFVFALACFPEDRQLAEDIVVQSLAHATRHIGRYDPRRSALITWLYAIARQQIRDEVRLQKRLKSVPLSVQTPIEDAAAIPDDQDLASTVAARVDARRLLHRLAVELPATEFEILVLNSIDMLSAKEIGRIVGRSERAVHSLLHRAKRKARERSERDE